MDSDITSAKLNILLIEDNPGDARLIQEMLSEYGSKAFELTKTDRLSAGLELLADGPFDLALLDLSLPDSSGLDTFNRIHSRFPDIAVVVLTGLQDEDSINRIIRAGAQDYLVKGEFEGDLMVRSIRYAIQRQALVKELEVERLNRRNEAENLFFERFTGSGQTGQTAILFGMGPLREILPEVFRELVLRYDHLMDKALEKRAYKVDYDISEELRAVGEELGMLKAVPRDVVEIHTAVLAKKKAVSTPKKYAAYAEEGRFMLLEMMGDLAAYYRRYSINKGQG